MTNKSTRAFITGSRGFIGSHLTQQLRENHFETFEFDKVIDANYDITSEKAIADALLTFEPSVVIHLAANAEPIVANERPEYDLSVNTIGTLNLIRSMGRLGRKPYVIIASSAYVYGNEASIAVNEKHPAIPSSPYGISKLAAESYMAHYSKKVGYEFCIMRFFNIYGPGQRAGFVIPDLIAKTKSLGRKKRLEMMGSPGDARDFLYVDDLIDAMIRLLRIRPSNEVFNAGSGAPTLIRDAARIILTSLGRADVRLIYEHPRPSSVFYSDSGKIRGLLGWTPRTSLASGIANIIEQAENGVDSTS